ncbi:MAG: DUF3108 domain-containing protein [Pyrinomonadaceae bacterium]
MSEATTKRWGARGKCLRNVLVAILWSILVIPAQFAELMAQDSPPTPAPAPTRFRVGEKLSYTVSYGKFRDAGYAEISVVSRGKLEGRDAVQLRSKIKTLDLVSAAFFQFDETRTAYAAADTGLPLYTTVNSHQNVLPKETVHNYLSVPTQNFDFLTLIYKAREAGGVGTFTMTEGEQVYNVTLQPRGAVTARTQIGNFDTTISSVQSDFLRSKGISDLFISFTNDEARLPVVIRFMIGKGEFKAVLSAMVAPDPEPAAVIAMVPVPTPVPTPKIGAAKPTPAPGAYVDNRPLAPELGFQLGELLNYRLSAGGKPVGTISLNARERKLVQKDDSLLLSAAITAVEPASNILRLGDFASAQVDPETLAPIRAEMRFASSVPGMNQTLAFDKRTGVVKFGPGPGFDAPIGTHTILSLIYAMRSFNLKPSRTASNPVNDTRVAVFWNSKAYIFTLRPADPTEITTNGEKVPAQLITVKTDVPELDALGLKVWLSTEDRVPLRFTAGPYQADLIAPPSEFPK